MTTRQGRRRLGLVARVTAGAVGLALVTATAAQACPPAGSHDHGRHDQGGQHAGGQAAPVVATEHGEVRGTATAGVTSFRGIPYAAPPVGDLRWQPPQPAASWSGVRDATSFAPHCAQSASPYGVASEAEDCLYLNVFSPQGKDDKGRQRDGRTGHGLPVMVWIHGGGLVVGESEGYDPAPLVRDGVIVVSINYRLGALGFLADQALADASGASGNYGLMDQQAALRWVQRNIASFGGDPRQVTIFGESAGGLSVLSQVVSPKAAGLFSAAIVESGAYQLTQPSQQQADANGEKFATAAGCTDPQQAATCLRQLDVSAILKAQATGSYQPVIDNQVLRRSIKDALSSGKFNQVPLVNGSNRDEERLFVGHTVTPETYQATLAATLHLSDAQAAGIAAVYPVSAYGGRADTALAAVLTDVVFACPALTVDQLASRYVRTYAYEFADENAPELFLPEVPGFSYGAAHASEIQYLFNLPATPVEGSLAPAQQRLARTMQGYWTSFADHHSPDGAHSPSWPPFTNGHPAVQSLVPPTPVTTTGFAAEHHCDLWSAARS